MYICVHIVPKKMIEHYSFLETQQAANEIDGGTDVAQHLNMDEDEGLPNISSTLLSNNPLTDKYI